MGARGYRPASGRFVPLLKVFLTRFISKLDSFIHLLSIKSFNLNFSVLTNVRIDFILEFSFLILFPNFSDGEGLDYEHAVLAVSRLARLHAISYCYRKEKVKYEQEKT